MIGEVYIWAITRETGISRPQDIQNQFQQPLWLENSRALLDFQGIPILSYNT